MFKQKYISNLFKASNYKKIVLHKRGNDWKIVQEYTVHN